MTPTLNEVNEVVAKRIHQLRKDIEEVETRLAMYRAELEPLLKIAEVAEGLVSVSKETVESSPAPVQQPVEVIEEEEEEEASKEMPRRWSRVNLAPRFRRFLVRFADAERVSRKEIGSWYRRAINPSIQDNSLDTMTSEVVRKLSAKGILVPDGKDSWRFVR